MADSFTAEKRSQIMARIKGQDTKPELLIRSLLHRMGYRFRLHRKDLPGKPDIVLPKHRSVIFIHGCFWHGHEGCSRSRRPTSNIEFWNVKIDRNIERDATALKLLSAAGWRVLVLWQCQLRNQEELRQRLTAFLEEKVNEY